MKYLISILLLFPLSVIGQDYWGAYNAKYIDNYDADSLTLRFEVWQNVEVTSKIRLLGLDTPEKGWRAKCDAESKLADEAKAFVTNALSNAEKIELWIDKRGKYGRLLGIVEYDGIELNKELIVRGYAYAYWGGKRIPWCGH